MRQRTRRLPIPMTAFYTVLLSLRCPFVLGIHRLRSYFLNGWLERLALPILDRRASSTERKSAGGTWEGRPGAHTTTGRTTSSPFGLRAATSGTPARPATPPAPNTRLRFGRNRRGPPTRCCAACAGSACRSRRTSAGPRTTSMPARPARRRSTPDVHATMIGISPCEPGVPLSRRRRPMCPSRFSSFSPFTICPVSRILKPSPSSFPPLDGTVSELGRWTRN